MYSTDVIIYCSFAGITLFVVIVAVVGCICENRRERIYADNAQNGDNNRDGNDDSDNAVDDSDNAVDDNADGGNNGSNIDNNIHIIELQL